MQENCYFQSQNDVIILLISLRIGMKSPIIAFEKSAQIIELP